MGSKMTKIHLILEKKSIWMGGGSPEIDQIIFFAIFFKKYKICRTFWYQVYPNRLKNKVSVIILVFFPDGVFFAEKANPYEKKVKKEKN